MDPRFLQLYTQELMHIRDMAQEFAQAMPHLAPQLGLNGREVEDPHVERLLEGFAFLAARVQLKLQEEFPQFTEHMLQVVHPGLRSTVPAMGVVQLHPKVEGAWPVGGVTLPKGQVLLGKSPGRGAPCRFVTGHSLNLWPWTIEHLHYTNQRPKGLVCAHAHSYLQLTLQPLAQSGTGTASLGGGSALDFYVSAPDACAYDIAHQLAMQLRSVWWRPPTPSAPSGSAHKDIHGQYECVGVQESEGSRMVLQPLGFEEAHHLLPQGPDHFSAYRVLQEWMAMPRRFLFFRLHGLDAIPWAQLQAGVELVFALNGYDESLVTQVGKDSLSINCVPVVNLFEHRCDRLVLDAAKHEHLLIADRMHPNDYEIHSVLGVQAYRGHQQGATPLHPLYHPSWQDQQTPQPGYVSMRRPKVADLQRSQDQVALRHVSSDFMLSFAWPEHHRRVEDEFDQIAAQVLCSNREWAYLIPTGAGATDLHMNESGAVQSIRFLSGPTRPYNPTPNGRAAWQLIQHLSLNIQALMQQQGATALRQLISLHAQELDAQQRAWSQAILGVECKPVEQLIVRLGRRLPARGMHVHMRVDAQQLTGMAPWLLGHVMRHVLARHVSLHGFVSLSVACEPTGHVHRWGPLNGNRPLC